MRRKKILKMKLQLSFVLFIFCAVVGSLVLPTLSRGSCRINDISLEKVGNLTKLTIYSDRPFEFVHSTLEEKDGKPHRVVIDCKDAIHNLPQHNFRKGLPPGTIKAIRTSQFQAKPEKIVRIVLDLDEPVIYKVVEKGEKKRGAITILTAQDPSFPLWAAAGGTKEYLEKGKLLSPKGSMSSAGEVERAAKKSPEERKTSTTSPTAKTGKKHIQKEPLLSQKEAISTAGEVEKATKELPEENKTDSLDLAAKEGKVVLLGPEEKSTMEKVKSPKSLVVISKPELTALEVVPQRRIIHYRDEGKRDPFLPLTERISTELGEIPLPPFESLKLVGVLRGEAGNRALLEDEKGYGYIMKNGDRIKNGYVVSVEDKKVIFQILEYGWSRTIALELSN